MQAFEITELIDRYLKNELTGEELTLFEKKIKEEPSLQREVELHRAAIQAVKVAELRKILRRTHQQISEEENVYPAELENAIYNPEDLVFNMASFKALSLEDIEYNFKLISIEENKPTANVSIAYEGELDPPFPILDVAGKKKFPQVKIVPASGSKPHYYQLRHAKQKATLHLYGDFNPDELTLIFHIQEGKPVFKLRVKAKVYRLQINKQTGSFPEPDKSD